jgi:hypothetical protein
VATYGDVILQKVKEFKIYVIGFAAALLVAWLVRKDYQKHVGPNT